MSRQVNVEKFMEVYRAALAVAVREHGTEYAYSVPEALEVAGRMQKAFEAGTYNHDSRAIKATCKKLGIKYTRKAIEAFFNGTQMEAK